MRHERERVFDFFFWAKKPKIFFDWKAQGQKTSCQTHSSHSKQHNSRRFWHRKWSCRRISINEPIRVELWNRCTVLLSFLREQGDPPKKHHNCGLCGMSDMANQEFFFFWDIAHRVLYESALIMSLDLADSKVPWPLNDTKTQVQKNRFFGGFCSCDFQKANHVITKDFAHSNVPVHQQPKNSWLGLNFSPYGSSHVR